MGYTKDKDGELVILPEKEIVEKKILVLALFTKYK